MKEKKHQWGENLLEAENIYKAILIVLKKLCFYCRWCKLFPAHTNVSKSPWIAQNRMFSRRPWRKAKIMDTRTQSYKEGLLFRFWSLKLYYYYCNLYIIIFNKWAMLLAQQVETKISVLLQASKEIKLSLQLLLQISIFL